MQITADGKIKRYRIFAPRGWWLCYRPCPRCFENGRINYLSTNGRSYQCYRCGWHEGPERPKGWSIEHMLVNPDSIGRIAPELRSRL